MEELTPERGVSDDCEVKTNDFYTNIEVERNGQGFRLLPSDARRSECSVGFQIYSWYAELAKHLNQIYGWGCHSAPVWRTAQWGTNRQLPDEVSLTLVIAIGKMAKE